MQQHPKAIPQVVAGYQQRLHTHLDISQRLSQNKELREAATWADLSQRVNRAMHRVDGYVSPLRFGQGDPESEEEKARALASYQKKSKIRQNLTLYIAIALGVLSLILAISLGIVLYQDTATVPAPVGTTEGWVYYQTDTALLRSTPEGQNETTVYETQGGNPYGFLYLVDVNKIYILDQGTLFSINADGSGKHKLGDHYSSTYSTKANNIFALCQGNLYVSSYHGGTFSGETQLYRVPVDGSKREKLEYLITVSHACCWEDQLYLFGISEEDGAMVYICDGRTGQVVEKKAEGFSYLTSDAATALYFSHSEGYFSLFDHDTMESSILKITPENLEGEPLERYPGEVMYMNPNYVVYCELTRVADHSYEVGASHLVNRNTGVEKSLPTSAYQVLGFVPTGVLLPQGEFESYP